MTRTQAKKDAARSRIAAALEAVDPNLKVADLESIIHYSFANKSMGWEALQLPGNGFATPFMLNGNKRLAIVGDLAIDLILSEPWYESGKDEGTWTSIRDAISSNDELSVLGRGLGLQTCIQNSVTNSQEISPYMMGTAVEAVVGAVYMDSGKDLEVVRSLLERIGVLTTDIESELHSN